MKSPNEIVSPFQEQAVDQSTIHPATACTPPHFDDYHHIDEAKMTIYQSDAIIKNANNKHEIRYFINHNTNSLGSIQYVNSSGESAKPSQKIGDNVMANETSNRHQDAVAHALIPYRTDKQNIEFFGAQIVSIDSKSDGGFSSEISNPGHEKIPNQPIPSTSNSAPLSVRPQENNTVNGQNDSNSTKRQMPMQPRNTSCSVRENKRHSQNPPARVRAPARRRTRRFRSGWKWLGRGRTQKIYLRGAERNRICFNAMKHKTGVIVRIGDFVLINNHIDELSYVSKVLAMWENPRNRSMMLSVSFFKRRDAMVENLPDELKDEVFETNHEGHVSVACVSERCYIMSEEEYWNYRRNVIQGTQLYPFEGPPSRFRERLRYLPRGSVDRDLIFYTRGEPVNAPRVEVTFMYTKNSLFP